MKALALIFCCLLLVACDRSLIGPEPAGGDVVIRFLKTTSVKNATAEFLIYNGDTSPVYFLGYGAIGPIYSVQSQSDTGWVDKGPYWCGTGLVLQKLKSKDSFKFTACLVDAFGKRRVGIWLYDEAGEFDRIVWSAAVKL